MRLSKLLSIILSITFVSVLYVYQQSNIIRAAYQEQKKLALLENLVDKNNNIRYNLNRQMSLVSIDGIWQEDDFEWPHQEQLVSLRTVESVKLDTSFEAKTTSNIFTSLFGLKAQAEATPTSSR